MGKRHFLCIGMLLVLSIVSAAEAQLRPGDMVIIGIHSDGTDRFVWVPLVDLEAGQVLFFTDAGWNAAQRMFQRQVNEMADPSTTSPSGGAIRYTVPPGGLAAGTVVHVTIDSRTTGEPGTYALTVTGADAGDFSGANDEDIVGEQGVSLATTGDQLIIAAGSLSAPVFIFGVNTGANRWDLGSTTAQHASDVPEGLVDSVTAVAIGAGPTAGDEWDNGRYVGPSTGTRAAILAAVADRNNWETSDDDMDDLTNGVSRFTLIPEPAPEMADTTVTLSLDTVFVEPDGEGWLTISLTNPTNRSIGGVQFGLYLNQATYVSLGDMDAQTIPAGFQIKTKRSAGGDTLKAVVFSPSGAAISPGAHMLGRLSVTAREASTPGIHGTESPIGFVEASVIVSDTVGNPIVANGTGGAVQVGIRSDVNRVGLVDIRDVIVFVAQLLGKHGAVLPDVGTLAFAVADGNTDGLLNVADAVTIINRILRLPVGTPKTIASGAAVARLGNRTTLKDGRTAVPVVIETSRPIAGAQMTFTFDPEAQSVGRPLLSSDAHGFIIDSHISGGTLRVVLYSLSAEGHGGENGTSIVMIPVATRRAGSEVRFVWTDIILADRQAQIIPVVIKAEEIDRPQQPRSFALMNAAPNPFNPSTTIQFALPEATHVRLEIYNVVGQLVRTLINGMRPAGYHMAQWDGRSDTGQVTASGLYIYRLTTEKFTEQKKMTLLK